MMILSAQMRRSRILQKCPGKAALCAAFAVTSNKEAGHVLQAMRSKT
jgi:hypothetical protein